jgi:hypothetical protein
VAVLPLSPADDSFLTRGDEIVAYTRLIDLETGAVRGAGELFKVMGIRKPPTS